MTTYLIWRIPMVQNNAMQGKMLGPRCEVCLLVTGAKFSVISLTLDTQVPSIVITVTVLMS